MTDSVRNADSELMKLQRRMASAVMQPLTRQETMRRRRADGSHMDQEANAFIKPNDRLTSFERLEIYNRQYWFRIFASFEEDFAGLQAVLGNKAFETLMHAYLESHPSSSFTLRNLGTHLLIWMDTNHSYLKPRTRLARDMAQLEWAHIEAYDSAEFPVSSPEEMAAVSMETQLSLQPYVQLLELFYPVDDLLIQVRHETGSSDTSSNNATTARKTHFVRRVAEMEPRHLYLAVHRQQLVVYYKRLQPEEYRMLQAIQAGETLGSVMELAFQESSMSEADRGPFLQHVFQVWATLGWLCQPQNL